MRHPKGMSTAKEKVRPLIGPDGALAGCGHWIRQRMGSLDPYLVVRLRPEDLEKLQGARVVLVYPEGPVERGVEVEKA